MPWHAFQRRPAADHYGRALWGRHQLEQINTQNTPLTLDNPHIHTPGMISCSPAPLAMPIRLHAPNGIRVPFYCTDGPCKHVRMTGVMAIILG